MSPFTELGQTIENTTGRLRVRRQPDSSLLFLLKLNFQHIPSPPASHPSQTQNLFLSSAGGPWLNLCGIASCAALAGLQDACKNSGPSYSFNSLGGFFEE